MAQAGKCTCPDSSQPYPLSTMNLENYIQHSLQLHFIPYKMTITIPTSAFSLILLQDPVRTVCVDSFVARSESVLSKCRKSLLSKCWLAGSLVSLLRTFTFLSQSEKQDNSVGASPSLPSPETEAPTCPSYWSRPKLQPQAYSLFNPLLTQQSEVWK